MATGFFFDEKCFWHAGGNYALTLPVGDLVQPLAAGGLPESPETKRRLKNLMDVTGLTNDLDVRSAPPATEAMLKRVHPEDLLTKFKSLSDAGGGELGLRTPFGKGGYEIAALSAGLTVEAVRTVATGALQNAYALSRPPGHHCLPDWPNGFCLLANIAIAVEEALSQGHVNRVAVLDWDVHHGNGTEAIFYDRAEVLTVSIHQERNYPMDTGDVTDRGTGEGIGANINIPLPPGAGHNTYLRAMEKIVMPAMHAHKPDMIIVASGYDANAFDPLARMLATADTFRQMTKQVMQAADTLCDGKLVLVHEGGYSEAYVPFCGHAAIETLAGSDKTAEDPMAATLAARQPNARVEAFFATLVDEMAEIFASPPG